MGFTFAGVRILTMLTVPRCAMVAERRGRSGIPLPLRVHVDGVQGSVQARLLLCCSGAAISYDVS